MADITSKITSIEPDDGALADAIRRPDAPAPRPAPSDVLTPAIDRNPAAYSASLDEEKTGNHRLFGWLSAALWTLILITLLFFVIKLHSTWQTLSPVDWAGVIGLIIAPYLFIWIGYSAMATTARLSRTALALAKATDTLSEPDQTVIGKSQKMSSAIATQIDVVNEKMNAAIGQFSALEMSAERQIAILASANTEASGTSSQIASSVEKQSSALSEISGTFDTRMGALSDMILSHTERLADATRMAEQKIKEARVSVEGAASKINTASDTVRNNTVQAASTLNASHQEIQSLGGIIRERSEELDQVYKKHAGDLNAMIEHLRDEQSVLGASLEERLNKMRDLSLAAQTSAESLSKASKAGKETVQALAQSASLADSAVRTRFDEMEKMVAYSTEHAQSIGDKASQRVQDSLEQTRKEISRIERDMAELQTRLSVAAESGYAPKPEPVQPTTAPETAIEKPKKRSYLFSSIEEEASSAAKAEIDIPEVKTEEKLDIAKLRPAITAPLKKEPAILEFDDTLDLHFEEESPEPSAFDKAIRSAVPAEYDDKPKGKSKFSLRGLFGGAQEDAASDSSLDIVADLTKQPGTITPPPHPDEAWATLLAKLASIGLAPNAVVDDGCIIEATNTRFSSGHEAMSKAVIGRLQNPVMHLTKALSEDAELSKNAIAFASDFDTGLEFIATNREAIRRKLESEDGRGYLLCDAALNFGRV